MRETEKEKEVRGEEMDVGNTGTGARIEEITAKEVGMVENKSVEEERGEKGSF